MDTFTAIASLILSVISVSIAVLAILQTNRQIKLSNKQHLFDRRLEKYILVNKLFDLYKNYGLSLTKNEQIYLKVDFCFNFLINITELESAYSVMGNPSGEKEKVNFLSKCEFLESTATEIELLWDNDSGVIIARFVRQYVELLKAMHKQQITIKDLENKNYLTMDIVDKKEKESAKTFKLFEALEKLDATYNEIIKGQHKQKLLNEIKF